MSILIQCECRGWMSPKAIVFVREHLPNGTKLSYGCPISAVEPLEIDVEKEG